MSINLLPPQLKKEKKLKLIFNQTFFSIFSILIMYLVAIAAFYTYDSYLKSRQKAIESKNSALNQELPSLHDTENVIKDINSRLSKIDDIFSQNDKTSELLSSIGQNTPANVQIKSLSINKSAKTVSLSGTAESRKDIALMKEKLETTSYFQNVIFSTSSYNQSTNDYTFSLSFELKK